MRAILTNFGTTGDVMPLIALGEGLRQNGHDPVLAMSPAHRDTVLAHGLDFQATGLDTDDVQRTINRAWQDESTYTSTDRMRDLLAPLQTSLARTYETLEGLAAHADVLVSGAVQPAARMVHEITGIPFVSVQTSSFGGSGAPALQRATAALINPFRASLGLPALRNPVTTDANSPQLALYAMSRHLIPKRDTWPPHYRVTGFLFVPRTEWTLDPVLAGFLDAGDPPVIISFGSMPHDEPEQLGDLVTEAVAMAGVRAVVQRAPGSVVLRSSPELHVTGFVPYRWLLPRGSCIVHHGGGGTAGWAFWSGRPTIYVPHGRIFDQHYWARLSRDCGCSGEAIPFTELTSRRLADAIRETLGSEQMRCRAASLGALIRAENGVGCAIQAIEALLTGFGCRAEV